MVKTGQQGGGSTTKSTKCRGVLHIITSISSFKLFTYHKNCHQLVTHAPFLIKIFHKFNGKVKLSLWWQENRVRRGWIWWIRATYNPSVMRHCALQAQVRRIGITLSGKEKNYRGYVMPLEMCKWLEKWNEVLFIRIFPVGRMRPKGLQMHQGRLRFHVRRKRV